MLQVEFWLSSEFLPLQLFSKQSLPSFFKDRKTQKSKLRLSEIGLYGEHIRVPVSLVSFKTCRVPNFRLRWKYFFSLFFWPEEFQSVFLNKPKLNLRLQFFVKNLFVGGTSPFFLHCAEQKPCELKRVQILLSFFTENIFNEVSWILAILL